MGLHYAGFDEIVGIDIAPHPKYPFEFIQADLTKEIPVDIVDFDFIWSSPPCQKFSDATIGTHDCHPDLIPITRKLLETSGLPYVIENVPKAPIRKDLMLCGGMFGLETYRHRHFEISGFLCKQLPHPKHMKTSSKGEVFCICGSSPLMPGNWGNREKRKEGRKLLNVQIKKRGGVTRLYQQVMGIYHTDNVLFIAEAVPPVYSCYIGSEFLDGIGEL